MDRDTVNDPECNRCGGPVSDDEESVCGDCGDELASDAGPTPSSFQADLETSFEDLLDSVWAAEANWRLDDRISLAVRLS